MRGQYRIDAIRRSDLYNHDRRIRAVAGVNPDGARWTINEQDAVAGIEAGRWSFFVETAGGELPVVVAVSKYGTKYLKGIDDRLHPESLLTLPECY